MKETQSGIMKIEKVQKVCNRCCRECNEESMWQEWKCHQKHQWDPARIIVIFSGNADSLLTLQNR